MPSRYRIKFILLQLLFLMEFSFSLRLIDSELIDKSGWKTVEIDGDSSIINRLLDHKEEIGGNLDQKIGINATAPDEKGKKLVEWDDDDLNESIQLGTRDQKRTNLMEPLQQIDSIQDRSRSQQHETRHRSHHHAQSSKKISKLIYHGQVKKNLTFQLDDGIKIHVNAYKPLTILRDRQSSHSSGDRQDETASEQPSSIDQRWSDNLNGSVPASKESTNRTKSANSNWKPIVIISRGRRSNKTKLDDVSIPFMQSSELIKLKGNANKTDSAKWKPIKLSNTDNKLIEEVEIVTISPVRITKGNLETRGTKKDFIIYGKKLIDSKLITLKQSKIEDPFDADDGLIVARQKDDSKKQQRESKSISRDTGKAGDDRWTPVVTTIAPRVETTTNEILVMTTTTQSQPTTTTSLSSSAAINNNGTSALESAAHRSASDVNYIYSSQPEWSSSRQSPAPSNSYYSNYLIQPTGPQAIQQPPQTIDPPLNMMPAVATIDTTSGQTPEMINDRAPDQSVVYDGYSSPQTSSSFQPIQQPPVRQSIGYDYTQRQSQQLYPLPQAPPARAQSPQVVRQEHHYHYYNQQQQQQPDRQATIPNQQPNVIRELQPLLISQPIIQQSSTTTPAPPPQIIREIIKEVPVQQFSRVIVPQQIPMPLIREVEPTNSYSYSADNPAQRIIRQLSNSIPTMNMRLTPVRLPVPTIQLPARLANIPGAVTRQTGSFVIPPMPKKTTTFLTETQAMPTHTTIMHTTQFTPATRTTVYTTDHQTPQTMSAPTAYKK